MAITLCDSCKTTSASLFCKADSAFLSIPCDGKIHAANKLASCHARVWMCDVCEQAPASVTCKADSAALCVTCDREIHSANPLARRHERFPVVPFYDPATATPKISDGSGIDNSDQHYLLDFDVNVAGTEAEEAEAASWLIPDLNPKMIKTADESEQDNRKSESKYLFNEIDSYPHIDLKTTDQKSSLAAACGYNSPTDGVVPVQNKSTNHLNFQMPLHVHAFEYASEDVVEGLPAYDVDYAGSKPFMYNFTSQSISQSVSSSSLDVGVVPDHNIGMVDISNNQQQQHQSSVEVYPTPLVGFDREARVLRYKEKRKNRKFEKTIRYASRKAYAETRPRIKGRFAKRTEIDVEADDSLISPESSYGVVPTY